ncbi:hypothetical protein SAMN05660206_101196 [Sphingobacterium wenxiniae]|uniref:Uncharacterized protein n=1 Tax=Sphingobacterium wenxiniae TaxID=683125 RepID=A0A1I6NZH8_9SPHI|nr:hypothetical protein SAMN05660206_101196 [Sphingobacterium wenxiniae]
MNNYHYLRLLGVFILNMFIKFEKITVLYMLNLY